MYYNINKSNELIYNSEDVKYDKKKLMEKFGEFISARGYHIVGDVDLKVSPYIVTIKRDTLSYKMIIYYKNITGAGWKDKPNIRRVQVTNVRYADIDKYISTSKDSFLAILGYYNYDNNPIMVAWNAYNFVYHSTTRSCYVTTDLLQEAYKSGYIKTNYSNQTIWIFTPDYFDEFINDYIECNRVK